MWQQIQDVDSASPCVTKPTTICAVEALLKMRNSDQQEKLAMFGQLERLNVKSDEEREPMDCS